MYAQSVIMFVNNFLAPIQVQLSPKLMVSDTLGHRGRGDYILEGQGRWGGMRSTEPYIICGCAIRVAA